MERRTRRRRTGSTRTRRPWSSSRTGCSTRGPLHYRMRALFENTASLTYSDLAKRKDTKKDAAQKFYSLLVLQKFHALDLDQSAIYGDLNITKGPCFDVDTNTVKVN